jgi:hypothetical protein
MIDCDGKPGKRHHHWFKLDKKGKYLNYNGCHLKIL